ncbi:MULTISPECIES: prepilin-type N-terminal cleavage/methylation domain-containing protein [Thermus]|uniref:prepilin-type N-terminal cleavage/methylation domain-containing protein n=1 Tax=Thermus brockianus TaxID=56956 RepID=UPI001F29F874|nr:prepilin-type N-terminal cleavage/methylation domain-containing protein [Thermus brockianus]
MRAGFTLIELLVVVTLLGFFLALTYLPIATTRKKANLTSAEAYVRNVAVSLEALRDPTGRLPVHLTDCLTGFGYRPRSISMCSISFPTSMDFVIEAVVDGATITKVIYTSENGKLTHLP